MSSPTNRVLLIVDDEADIREVLSEMLRKVTSEIKMATNGKEALQLIRTGGIDAVISDINMPVMSGLQLLAEVRHLCVETPFVMVSAFSDKNNLREALRLDATDFIDKPFDIETVRRVVDQALDVGIALKKVQEDLEKLYASSSLPPDRLIRSREIKQSVMMLKAKSMIYFKKAV